MDDQDTVARRRCEWTRTVRRRASRCHPDATPVVILSLRRISQPERAACEILHCARKLAPFRMTTGVCSGCQLQGVLRMTMWVALRMTAPGCAHHDSSGPVSATIPGRGQRLKLNTSLRSSIVWFGLDRQLT